MSQWSSVGAMGVASQNTAVISTTSNGNTIFTGKIQMENGAVVEGIDVGDSLKLLIFFLQSRHPEVFEEYKAIEKIKKS